MERRRVAGSAAVKPLEESSATSSTSTSGPRSYTHKFRAETFSRGWRIMLLLSSLLFYVVVHTTTWKTWNSRWGFDEKNEKTSVLPNSQDACSGYRGVLHIAHGDTEGAAGTVFFLFVLNQVLYAQEFNLIPWIHLNNVSHHIFDPKVHGSAPSRAIVVSDLVQPSWQQFRDPITKKIFGFPGPPPKETSTGSPRTVIVTGSGVWNSYFEPVSNFLPSDPSCRQLPLIRLSYSQIIPGLHLNCPWSLRAWRYGGLPPLLRNDKASYENWFRPMRQRGSRVVKQYIRFRPHIIKKALKANPSERCLGVHIRHSDKANRRQKIPPERFYPYMDVYLEQFPEGKIFLATDSSTVLKELQSLPQYQDQIMWQDGAARSQNSTAVFRQHDHHDTNTQVLVDINALSKCQFLLHGLSAVSEAVLYLNPALQSNRSVNLDLPKPIGVRDFAGLAYEYKNNILVEK